MKEKLKGIIRYLPDKSYLKIKYAYIFKKKLDLKNPLTFNEKLQWLKLYNRNPIYTKLVDKYEVKKYVSDQLGEGCVAKVYGIYDNFEAINFDTLPNSFVIKCTHDSGGIIVCKDKSTLNIDEARKKINECLFRDFYSLGREWPYKNVPKRILIEEYLSDESDMELKDYKIYCFNGKAKYIHLDYDRFKNHHRNMYDCDWNQIDLTYTYESDKTRSFAKPERLEEMLACAEKLSLDIPFVRCDFYHLKDRIVFGEMTFFPESGFGSFNPEEYNLAWGGLIDLNSIKGR